MGGKAEEYGRYTDEELIARMRRGESGVMDYLMDKYKNLVRKKARTLYLMGGDGDDLIQEGMIGLFKAVRDYDPEREGSFSGFAALCVLRQMYTAVEASCRKKHIPLNSYVSLYSGTAEEGKVPLREVLADPREGNPEDLVLHREAQEQMAGKIKKYLSRYEIQVLEAYLNGMSSREIGRLLGKTPKSIDNALQRIRRKMTSHGFSQAGNLKKGELKK